MPSKRQSHRHVTLNMSDNNEASQPGFDGSSCWMLVVFVTIGVQCCYLMLWVECKRGVSEAHFDNGTNELGNKEARKGDIEQTLKVESWQPDRSVYPNDDEESDLFFLADPSPGSLAEDTDPMEALQRVSKLSPSCTEAASADGCAICLSSFKINQLVCESDGQCAHMFHVDCMKQWLLCHDTCPLCRVTYF
jgi:Ring finger domain